MYIVALTMHSCINCCKLVFIFYFILYRNMYRWSGVRHWIQPLLFLPCWIIPNKWNAMSVLWYGFNYSHSGVSYSCRMCGQHVNQWWYVVFPRSLLNLGSYPYTELHNYYILWKHMPLSLNGELQGLGEDFYGITFLTMNCHVMRELF